MKKDVVVVTIQYRLGTLGFLSAGSSDFPGNAGLFDIALATEWIKNYVAFFGGNANTITVMGQGTGGSCALLVAMSNLAKGKYKLYIRLLYRECPVSLCPKFVTT